MLLLIIIATAAVDTHATWLGIARRRCKVRSDVYTRTISSTSCHKPRVAKIAQAIAHKTVQAVITGTMIAVDRGDSFTPSGKLIFHRRQVVTHSNDLVDSVHAATSSTLVVCNCKFVSHFSRDNRATKIDKFAPLSRQNVSK